MLDSRGLAAVAHGRKWHTVCVPSVGATTAEMEGTKDHGWAGGCSVRRSSPETGARMTCSRMMAWSFVESANRKKWPTPPAATYTFRR